MLDARSQFIALACGAMISRCGGFRVGRLSAARLLSNATHVLVHHIGRMWVVPAGVGGHQRRAIGFSVCGNDPFPCGDCCLVVFVGISPTLGVVWDRVHLFGGSNFGSVSRCSNRVRIGCYLGCGRWLALFGLSSFVDPVLAMAEDDGRMMIATAPTGLEESRSSLTHFESNSKWLVLCRHNPYLRWWKLDGGLPVGHSHVYGFGAGNFFIRVRFHPMGCNSHHCDELVVANKVTSDAKEVDATELLFVDLQASFVDELLVVTRRITIPHLEVVDFQWVSHDEFLLLSWSKTGIVLQRVVQGQVAGAVLFPEPKYVWLQFLPPSHVLARTKASGELFSGCSEVYSASNLSEPLYLQTYAVKVYLHSGFAVFTSSGVQTVRKNFQDVETGRVLLESTAKLPRGTPKKFHTNVEYTAGTTTAVCGVHVDGSLVNVSELCTSTKYTNLALLARL
ncbi:hypothetical protein Pelo_18600 [Pelomyxa schiedti]|nr:hypothetical protein Pelo_18600 [Pelomyxa schiedti]